MPQLGMPPALAATRLVPDPANGSTIEDDRLWSTAQHAKSKEKLAGNLGRNRGSSRCSRRSLGEGGVLVVIGGWSVGREFVMLHPPVKNARQGRNLIEERCRDDSTFPPRQPNRPCIRGKHRVTPRTEVARRRHCESWYGSHHGLRHSSSAQDDES